MAPLSIILDLDPARRQLREYTLDVERATDATRRFARQVDRTPTSFNAAAKGATTFRAVLGTAFRTVSGLVGGFIRQLFSLKTLLVGLVTGVVARQLVRYADGWTNLNNRIRAFIPDGEKARAVLDRLFETAQQTRNPLQETTGLFSRLLVSQDTVGVSTDDLLRFTRTVGQSIRLSGSSQSEAGGALVQLSQLLGNSQIRAAGQELASIREQAPYLFRVLLDGLSLTEGQFRQLAEAGKLTSKQIIQGVNGIGGSVDEMFSRLAPTIGESMTMINSSLFRTIGLISQATGLAERFASFLGRASVLIDNVGTIAESSSMRFSVPQELEGPGFVTAGQRLVSSLVTEFRLTFLPAFGEIIAGAMIGGVGVLIGALTDVVPAMVSIMSVVAQSFAEAIVSSFEKIAPRLAAFFVGERGGGGINAGLLASTLSQAGSQFRASGAERLRSGADEIARGYSAIRTSAASIAADIESAAKAQADLNEKMSQGVELAKENAEGVSKQVLALAEVGARVGQSFGDSFKSIIDGTATVRDAFENLVKDIYDILYQQLITRNLSAFFSGLFSNLGGTAAGTAIVGSARGNAFMNGSVVPFASGGVVDRTAIFPLRDGKIGMMGEAGPEAVLPITRLPGGNLGVKSQGGGTTVINITVRANDPREFGRSERQLRDSVRRALR